MTRRLSLMAMAILLAGSTTVMTSTASGTGLMTCDSGDRSTWKSSQALVQKISKEGWKVRRTKVDGGCYEVYGTSPKGQRVEAYFHPVTLELLLIARRGEILYRKK